MARTTKAELVEKIADKLALSKSKAAGVIEAVLEAIGGSLHAPGDQVTLVGFGSFKVKTRAARKGTNPLTQAKMDIPAKNVVKFEAGKALEDQVNGVASA